MAKYVTRTFATTTVKPSKVAMKNGKIEASPCEPFELEGYASEDVAIKAAGKLYGRNSQYIVELSTTEKIYGMPVEKFREAAVLMENGKPVEA